MEKLNLKDKKILYELDINSRQSFRGIGRKVGLSKDIVASRVKNLQDKGVILKYYTVFDYLRLGLTLLRFYFKFQYITSEIREEIISHFVKCEYSTSVGSIEGNYDLVVMMLVKNDADIYPFWQKTLDKFGDYFANRIYSVYMGESIYTSLFLLDEKEDRTKYIQRRGIFKLGWEKVIHDDLDLKILKILAFNARMPTIEIAKELNLSALTINNRIKKLIESEIITGFKVIINWSNFGYNFYKVDLFLRDHNKIHQIIKYIERNPHLFTVDFTLGYADLELEFILKNLNQLHEIIENLSCKFPKIIRNYTYFTFIKVHKFLIL